MDMARTFKEIIAWQKAHQLTLSIYQITTSFPDQEKFGLTSQMRCCSVMRLALNFYHFFDLRAKLMRIFW